ncbi:ATP-dependent DNA ligase [Baekduia alba]|uniref:DNA ligase D n=1 Tax=Baekduia alba TaxID=2997333 RepID=UPI00234271E9|nr:DNA ligase D [Baekduia alba]WCB94259.1 ATP-dependent DNA ligase [Baekduia alba]
MAGRSPNLEEYARKRDFGATPEPAGDASGDAGGGAPRFVIQEHSATRLHWDLRLEHDGALASWAIPNGLPWAAKDNRVAVHTEDHPLEYLEFHGEIPKGSYGAGTMTIWDRGTYEVLKWDAGKKVEVALHGERVTGQYALFPIGPDPKDWMIHRMGAPATDGWVLGTEPMPTTLVPMLAKPGPVPSAREDPHWAYEIKWDGVRAVVFSEPGRMRFVTRNGNDVTARYPELARMNRALSMHRVVLDGEVVAFDADGRPSFGALQGRMHLVRESAVKRLAKENPVTYMAFDLLWLDGASLMGRPYHERRATLRALLADGERWQVPDHVVGGGTQLLAATREQGLEGVVAKRVDSPYEPGRRGGAWRKIKNTNRQELVIGGWLPGEGRRRERIGALLVGVRESSADGEPLRFAGRVGTGFTEAELDRLAGLLGPLVRETSPFDVVPKAVKIPREAVWVEPELVAEVEFVEWTREGVLRAPSYKGLREDKPATLVVREPVAAPKGTRGATAVRAEIDGRELRLTNLEKALWPSGHTKGDLIRYYVELAPVLLSHLQGRPLTLKRYPHGSEGEFFYEKQAPQHRPDWIATAPVKLEKGKVINYVLAEDPATLAWLGNLADLELHTPMHRAARDSGRLSGPTMVAFDLDPGEPAGLLECCRVATVLQGMFQHLGLVSVPKTSGSKGMQVYVPLNVAGVTYAQTKGFAKAVAELLEAEAGDLVVSRQTKALRKGKVLVDWSQNDVNKTTVAPYSPRARDRPSVSTPLTWDEVQEAVEADDASALSFDMDAVLARVRDQGDLFAEALTVVQELPIG